MATKDNLYLQEWKDSLKTIFQAAPTPTLDTNVNVTAAICFCSFNLLAWKLFQG